MRGDRLIVALVLSSVASSPLFTYSFAHAAPRCLGKAATLVGTPGKDKLTGGAGSDIIVGLGGRDALLGGGGKDRLCGSGDDDVLVGGKGADKMAGGADSDSLLGGGGHDEETGGGGDVDVLRGQAGNDRLTGGGGDDILVGQEGSDRLSGGGGFDLGSFLFAQAGVTVDLTMGTATGEGNDTLTAIEDLEGSRHNDILTGNAGDNFFYPHLGDDVINGGDGIHDGAGFFFSLTAVTVDLTLGTATGEGSDTLTGIEDSAGSVFDDTLTGSALSNFLFGFMGNDTISGLDGDDFLDGDVGTDTADGGLGAMDRCVNFENGSPPPGCEFTTPRGRSPQSIYLAG